MEAARARGRARWAAAGETKAPQEKPPASTGTPWAGTAGAVVAMLVLGGVALATFDGGAGGDETALAQPSHSYVPGLITPAELPAEAEQPAESSEPGLSSPATRNAVPPAGDSGKTRSYTTGPGCGGYTSVGSYRDGRKGWVDHGDGRCGTTFVSVPMSGDPRRDDPGSYAQWTFAMTGSCELSVFIPDGGVEEVGGNPTVYYVFDGDGVIRTPTASFAIKQVEKRGQWVRVGRFRASGNLTVQLLNRGQNTDAAGPTLAHHAAGAVKADCTA
ncbi:translation initiation factor IF-2 [Lentzea fradiae]|uniref:Translation initiation factor IF-2 n=2 Tax=Lentzea fradiae TaxID=200378 RepID=A0A1G7P5R8_9PSEU|nr:translation initiation factor IF-2 [Lentzea fradiae]